LRGLKRSFSSESHARHSITPHQLQLCTNFNTSPTATLHQLQLYTNFTISPTKTLRHLPPSTNFNNPPTTTLHQPQHFTNYNTAPTTSLHHLRQRPEEHLTLQGGVGGNLIHSATSPTIIADLPGVSVSLGWRGRVSGVSSEVLASSNY
jgi:hypothetical protein